MFNYQQPTSVGGDDLDNKEETSQSVSQCQTAPSSACCNHSLSTNLVLIKAEKRIEPFL